MKPVDKKRKDTDTTSDGAESKMHRDDRDDNVNGKGADERTSGNDASAHGVPEHTASEQHAPEQSSRGQTASERTSPEPAVARKDQLVDPEKEIARLGEELARTRDSMLRKAAEFENLKRRTQKEKLQLFEEARADAVSRFLPIREDLKRSVEASEGKNVEKGFVEGLRLVLSNFERVLQDYGVEAIEETGIPFDVERHDAMLIQPAPDESTESNTVLQILEPGYKIGDRVIRHAKVIVSQ